MPPATTVDIHGEAFHVDGRPTYPGRSFRGMPVEGLLLNARLVQGIFDDLNPRTRGLWDYPDGPFDPERNTREFLAAMPVWRRAGLTGFTINLQGGSPQGYSQDQPWINSAIAPEGDLRADFLARLERILDRAAELGMAVILGYFYFGQEPRLAGEEAILRATDAATDWLLAKGYAHVLVEINNEADVRYRHEIVKPPRVHELIRRVQQRSAGKVRSAAGRLLVSASMGGGNLPPESLLDAADFVLLHGNGVEEPDRIRRMVRDVRARPAYRGQPILFNEDDHFDFDRPDNNFLAAVGERAGWGYFDFRMRGEGYADGFQSVPVDWLPRSPRKTGFFRLLAEMAGGEFRPR